MSLWSKIVWFTKFRKTKKANALGLIAGGCVYFGGQSLNEWLELDALTFEAFLGGLSLFVALILTKLYRILATHFPVLQKLEDNAKDLLDKVPEIERKGKGRIK